MTTKQELIDHFVSVGIPKFVAKRMAKLTVLDYYPLLMHSMLASECVSSFSAWSDTPEGHTFWEAVNEHFVAKEAKK